MTADIPPPRAKLTLNPGVTLYLARHGQTRANVERRFSSKADTPLTELGRAQARTVAQILEREVGRAPALDFISSPFPRATATMAIVLAELGLPSDHFTADERIAEIDLGKWDQLTHTEARALDPEFFDARLADKGRIAAPGGENYAQVAARVTDWARELNRDCFAVSHGATTRILRGLVLGLSWQEMSGLDEPQGMVFRLRGNEVERLGEAD